jgi:hypothetical protein
MNIAAIRSGEIYEKMALASEQEKNAIYRYELMKRIITSGG